MAFVVLFTASFFFSGENCMSLRNAVLLVLGRYQSSGEHPAKTGLTKFTIQIEGCTNTLGLW